MYENILKSFISSLGFVSEKLNLQPSKAEIKILNNYNESNQIQGIITTSSSTEESEIIFFESHFNKSDEMLIFKTKYQYAGRIYEEVDTFAIANMDQRGYYTHKTKLLIHVVDGKIVQSYSVGKKYKFENGISENLSKLNMRNKDVINMLNNSYENHRRR